MHGGAWQAAVHGVAKRQTQTEATQHTHAFRSSLYQKRTVPTSTCSPDHAGPGESWQEARTAPRSPDSDKSEPFQAGRHCRMFQAKPLLSPKGKPRPREGKGFAQDSSAWVQRPPPGSQSGCPPLPWQSQTSQGLGTPLIR